MNWQLIAALLLLAILTAMGGLFIALKKPSWYTKSRQEQLIALSTGLLLGIAFFEFLPHSLEAAPSSGPFLILAGLLFILFVERFIAPKLPFFKGQHCREHEHHLVSHQAACSTVGCLIVCAFFDGLEITMAFSLGPEQGWPMTLALICHILPDGALAANIALAGGMSRRQAQGISCITGLSLLAGAGSTLLVNALGETMHHFILPFATGVLLYVALGHLLPVGMKHPRGYWWLACGAFLFALFAFFSHGHGHY